MELPTVIDPWHPRTDRWARRSPSRHATLPNRPIFIGACPRSGTTLLRSLLDNHPDLAIPPETDFVLPLWRSRVRFGDLRVRKNRRAVAAWIFRTDGHGGRRIRARGLRDRMPTRKEAILRVRDAAPTLGSLLAACFELYAESHGKPRWGDKRPAYAGHVGAVFQLFPHAQFINVVRDPRGAVSSLVQLGWHREKAAVAASTATWEMSVKRVDAFARRLRPDQLLDIRYEDLVRDPHATLARVCAWAGLRHDPALIEQMIAAERRGAFRPGWHDRLGEPIDVAPVTAWQERLTPEQVAFVEQVTMPFFERFGYRPTPGLEAEVDPFEFVRIERHRRRRRRKWRRERLNELKRRLLYRRSIAAVRNDLASDVSRTS